MTDGQTEQLDGQTANQQCACLASYDVPEATLIGDENLPTCPGCGATFDGGGPPRGMGPNNGSRGTTPESHQSKVARAVDDLIADCIIVPHDWRAARRILGRHFK
jgi:hypothetical protein